ncbi:MAG: hypothetical protein JWO05_3770 [Gemmatimonadetes bacterium]|nr:hypothetical protein [Gemmatimonadota bacterium]
MTLLTVDPTNPDDAALGRATEVLRHGGLVAFPTETVYGLGAHALDTAAVERIYEAKGRPAWNPLIVHVANAGAARALTASWPREAELLAVHFWPGPLTLVLPRDPAVPDIVTAGLDSVGVRVPSHPVALALLRACGLPLAAPSANRSNELSPTTAQHVVKSLGSAVELVLDGGATSVGIESTVLDLRDPAHPVVLRPGAVSAADIAELLGVPVLRAGGAEGDVARPSPGMTERHYSPRAALRLVDDDGIATLVRRDAGVRNEALLVMQSTISQGLMGAFGRVETMPDSPEGYARVLYARLHALDDAGVTDIYVQQLPDGAAWDGVRDRLARATRHD